MGIDRPILELYANLHKQGFFKRIHAVMELGAQELIIPTEQDLEIFLKSIGMKNIKEEIKKANSFKRTIRHRIFFPYRIPAKKVYEWLGVKGDTEHLGIENYECIDFNGLFDSHVFDLAKDLQKEYSYNKQFDLVTNFGTSEHIFDQKQCFTNIHNLTKKGGYMLHSVPMIHTERVNHAPYYLSPVFYIDLAKANNYEIESISVQINNEPLKPYAEGMFMNINGKAIKWVLLLCLLKKTTSEPFIAPYQESYAKTSKINYITDTVQNLNFNAAKRPLWKRMARKILEMKV